MKDKDKTKIQLINELKELRQRIAELEGQKTELKLSDKAQQKPKERYLSLLKELPDIVYKIDPDGYFTFVNNAVRSLGYEPEELIGKHFSKIIHPDDFISFSRYYILPKYKAKITGDENAPKLFDERRTGERKTKDLEIRLLPKKKIKIKKEPKEIFGKVFTVCDLSSAGYYETDVENKNKKFLGTLGIIRDITERKKTEKALRESEEQFRTFAENIPGVVNIYDIYPDGRRVTIYISPGLKELLGDATAEKIGDNIDSFFELIHPDDLEQLQKAADFAQASGQALDHEYRVRRIDSEEYKWVRSTGILNPMGNGVLRWQGQLYDITERKQVEERERLHTQNLAYLSKTALEFVAFPPERNISKHIAERIKEIAGDSIVVISSFDEGSRLLQCRSVVGLGKFTNRFLKLFGKDPLEICIPISEEAERGLRKGNFVKVPGGLYVFTLGQIPEKACKAIEKLLGLGNIYAHGIAKEGTLFGTAVLLTRTKTDIKNRTVIETFISQASTALQHRLAEEELRKSEEKFRLLVENLPQKIFLKDKNSVYISCNKNYARDLKIEPDKIAGKTDYDFYPEELAEKYRADDKRIVESGKIEDIEEKYIVDGKEVFVHTIKTPVKDNQANVIGILGIFWDITEHRQLEQQLRHSQKMEAIGRLAGGIAHKFNNLLMALRGYSVLLLKQLSDSDPLYENAKKISEVTSNAALLTRQLLAFSRKQTLDLTIVDPNLLIAETGKMFQPIIGEHINLVTHLDPEIEHVKVDRDQFEQVIMNLVVNARDAMTRGSTLTIETRNITLNDEDCQSIKESKPGRFVCLLIKDTGMGMDEKVVKHIFEPFFSTKERGKGTGLGLSTVYGIIKQHGGWINVYSKLSKGTTFEIYLPAVSFKPEKSTKETDSVQNLLGRGEKILLVEDDEGICKFAAIALRKNNYVVFSASNVQTALDTFHKEKGQFDLLFCDVVLFNESGLELVDKLLSLKPKLNTLLTSGSLDKKTQRVVTGEKGFLFLEKPYHITELLQAVKKAIDKR